ncbi:MAG: phosphotransferase [Christensenellales bacterium]|jgi:aminoglycoside phosphotransferase (APT) family kinase protein
MKDIPSNDSFAKIEPITKGWSGDKKYRVETADGRQMLLRVSDIAELDRKKAEYEMMERVYNHGILTPPPIEFGLCDDGRTAILFPAGLTARTQRRRCRSCPKLSNMCWG